MHAVDAGNADQDGGGGWGGRGGVRGDVVRRHSTCSDATRQTSVQRGTVRLSPSTAPRRAGTDTNTPPLTTTVILTYMLFHAPLGGVTFRASYF